MTENNFSIISKRGVLQLSATFFIALFILAACKKDETDIGSNLQGEGLNVHTTDTFTLLTYTDTLDSLQTDETAVNMLGYYVDPVFGSVDCGIVTQVRLSGANPDLTNIIVDSVVLALAYTSINWYGNLDDVTVEVYELDEDLEREDQEYYAWSNPMHKGVNLVETGFDVITPDPVLDVPLDNGDTLPPQFRIRLDSMLVGDELVAVNQAGSMSSDDAFVLDFKGLYIKANGSSIVTGQGGILYFALESSYSKMTLYFHESGDTILQEYDFAINNSAARYNKITYDRTGTDVETVMMDTTQGQDLFYAQAGSAWGVIQIPHIMELNKDSLGNEDRKIINKAVLVIPVQDFAPDAFDPSTSLYIARIIDESVSDFTRDYGPTSALPFYDQEIENSDLT